MKILFFAVLAVIFVVTVILLYRNYYVKRKFRKLTALKYKLIEPLVLKLASKQDIAEDEVLSLVKNPSLRHAVLRVLELHKRMDLFPALYFTAEKAGESFLVNWLEFPTELGSAPDEIEFLANVTIDDEGETVDYYVYKFKTNPPHWAAQHGWMTGVTGPYLKDNSPYEIPLRVFSRFNTVDSTTPEAEVAWVHENIHQHDD
ncbi:hypothetical protein [Ohtaekwangia koreensis]|uniref:Uncharacterized protein n=1 Tax=Ohtaekwangia koreensis TaxID=688867 RepID=A0A1T5LNJ1_9BACT|nr:hypothetical protein [Ohtaekwangia koreensis]SKC77536.1 hypothetical protein SAMN05660236_3602 [Ohtaekwangia koreensis]